MKILVTGGTGYIGSHTVVELQQQGYEVVIIDNLCNSFEWVVDNIGKISGIRPGFERIDLCDKPALTDFFARHSDIGAVIHFAALKAVGESTEKPLYYYHNNLVSLMNLLELMTNNDVKHLVFSSSCTVYGQPLELPVTENTPVQESYCPYGTTKIVSENIIKDVCKISDLKAVALRYFNPIGAHESALIGELPLGVPNNLVPYITQTAVGKREVLSIYGNNYNTPDGTCIRDYIHVVDAAKAHITAIKHMISGVSKEKFEVFNIGTGNGNSVLEIVNTFMKVSGVNLEYRITGRRPGDVEKVWADTSKANRDLGWKAEKTLEDMLLSAWNWEQHTAILNHE
ncbi:MAG: UDP-glucose 4-epimerase GalE [Bacteroidota bacterium]